MVFVCLFIYVFVFNGCYHLSDLSTIRRHLDKARTSPGLRVRVVRLPAEENIHHRLEEEEEVYGTDHGRHLVDNVKDIELDSDNVIVVVVMTMVGINIRIDVVCVKTKGLRKITIFRTNTYHWLSL